MWTLVSRTDMSENPRLPTTEGAKSWVTFIYPTCVCWPRLIVLKSFTAHWGRQVYRQISPPWDRRVRDESLHTESTEEALT